jgi:Calcineurin-like phosphoesterase
MRIGLAALAALALALVAIRGCGRPASAPRNEAKLELRSPVPVAPGAPLLSLLAVGDTGQSLEAGGEPLGQLRVARALADADARRPADALLLLGDNFYPDGLTWAEVVDRVRANLVGPYCRFAVLAGALSPRVRSACASPRSGKTGFRIYAVLGNHDHHREESPTLERHAVRWFVSNWHMPAGQAESVELGHGVSLILLDSKPLRDGAGSDELRAALATARGPWRVLVAHHPIASTRDPSYAASRKQRHYADQVRDAIASSGAPIQLVLAGHDHLLGASVADVPAGLFNAIAGSGSRTESYGQRPPNVLFRASQQGFARVDLVRTSAGERLVVSLVAVPESGPPGLAARFEIDPAGGAKQTWPVTSPYTRSQ